MAEVDTLQDTTLPSDADLFKSSSEPADTPVADTPAETEPKRVVDEQGKVHGEGGRYVSKEAVTPPAADKSAATPATLPPAQTQDTDGGNIPAWRLREEAEKRREFETKYESERNERTRERAEFQAMQQRLQALEKPAKAEQAIDPLLDPEGYARSVQTTFDERLRNQERNFDMRLSHFKHGKVFEEAYTAAQQALQTGDVQLSARMNAAASPGEELVKWHQERRTMQEVGNDPTAWLEKKLEERLSDPAFLAKAVEKARGVASDPAQQGARPVVKLPPSLSSVTRGDNTETTGDPLNRMSDEALFAQAIKR